MGITREQLDAAIQKIEEKRKAHPGHSKKWYRKQRRIMKIAQASRRRNRK